MNYDPEAKPISQLIAILSPLDNEAATQVIQWAGNRFGVVTGPMPVKGIPSPDPSASSLLSPGMSFADLAEFYHAAAPSTDAEKALVIGYWFQELEQEQSLDAQRVNTALKQLGYRLTNITSAFTDLMEQIPSLAIQIQKSGSTQQARKKYKLTVAGVRKVQQMISARSM